MMKKISPYWNHLHPIMSERVAPSPLFIFNTAGESTSLDNADSLNCRESVSDVDSEQSSIAELTTVTDEENRPVKRNATKPPTIAEAIMESAAFRKELGPNENGKLEGNRIGTWAWDGENSGEKPTRKPPLVSYINENWRIHCHNLQLKIKSNYLTHFA